MPDQCVPPGLSEDFGAGVFPVVLVDDLQVTNSESSPLGCLQNEDLTPNTVFVFRNTLVVD